MPFTRAKPLGEGELAARHNHGVAAYFDRLESLRAAGRAGVQHGRSANLDSLLDRHRLAEADAAATGEVHREWSGRGAGGRILRNTLTRCEDAVLPAVVLARENCHGETAQPGETEQIRVQSRQASGEASSTNTCRGPLS